jgi:hypothetical protein
MRGFLVIVIAPMLAFASSFFLSLAGSPRLRRRAEHAANTQRLEGGLARADEKGDTRETRMRILSDANRRRRRLGSPLGFCLEHLARDLFVPTSHKKN